MTPDGRDRKRRPTLADVARAARVDPSIVSRVFNGGETTRVREETRVRIFQAAEELGYRPHSGARALSLGRTRTIGVISPSLTAVGYASMIDGIERAAEGNDYAVLWVHAADNAEDAAEQVRRVASRVDGIIMASARGNGLSLEALKQTGVPFVLLNRAGEPSVPSVIADDAEGARLAVAHLVSLGHSSIALVTGSEAIDTVARRRQGYERALIDADLVPSESLTHECDLSEAGGSASTRALLAHGSAPTAILFATITVALGGLRALREMRVAVPREMSVVSFDDSPIIEHLAVPLTAVRMPHAEMGDHATRSLIANLEVGTPLESEMVETGPLLIVRQSTTSVG